MPDANESSKTHSQPAMPAFIGHYRIIERLGKGGMGEVFLAEDTKQHGRKVALKVLPAELTKDENRVKRFKKEARAVLALNHPNILTIFEIGQAGALYYMATEYIQGETMRRRLWQRKIKIDEALGIAIQVAMALEAAHAAGIVHRDIKPENVMLREDRFVRDRIVKVLDFGLVKLIEPEERNSDPEAVTIPVSNTSPGAVMGTTGYMSPEQTLGEAVDARSDIFSLGVLLYEMVAGRPPFKGKTDSHVRVSIMDQEPAPLTSQSSEVPRQLERIVYKALAKDKSKRYQTATDLKLDLEQLREELRGGASEIQQTAPHPVTLPGSGHGSHPGNLSPTESRPVVDTEPVRSVPTVLNTKVPAGSISYAKVIALSVAALVLTGVVGGIIYSRLGSRTITSVAILPFANDTADPNAEYLSDGITESIINSLSQLPNLRVMSRNAVFSFKDRKLDPQEIGRKLKVGAVLTGRVVRQGDRFVIKTELIKIDDGSQLWGSEFNNGLSDILSIQDEISRHISEELKLKLNGAEAEKLAKHYTTNTEAYQLYLKGRYFWNKRDEAGLRNGIKFFKEAEEKDPTYALAYSGLADSYALLSDIGAVPPNDEMPNAKAAAQRAVDIDPSLAEGYTSRAFVKLAYGWDWLGAEKDFQKALELNPQYPTAHQWYASYLVQMGKFDRAMKEIEKAHELDPLSPIISSNLGFYSYLSGRYDEAIAEYKKTLELDQPFWVAHHYLGLAYAQKGMNDQAIAELRMLIKSPGDGPIKEGVVEDNPEAAASLGYVYAAAGRRADAELILARLKALAGQRYVSPLYFATIYAGLKDRDHAVEYLNKAFEGRHPGLVLIRIEPMFQGLRSDQRFQQLIKRFEPIP